MVGVHIAHNCIVGDDNIFTNGAALAGHIEVEDHVFLSNNVGAHQFVRIGPLCDGWRQVKDRAGRAAVLYHGWQSAACARINSVGLRRAGFSTETRRALKNAYHLLFRSGMPLEDALRELELSADENVRHLVNFIRGSKRGFYEGGENGEGEMEKRISRRFSLECFAEFPPQRRKVPYGRAMLRRLRLAIEVCLVALYVTKALCTLRRQAETHLRCPECVKTFDGPLQSACGL